jgi:hypothetical protein
MEQPPRFSYTLGHATPWNRTAVGAAAPTGHPVAQSGQGSVGRGPCRKRVCEFGIPLVPDIPHEGPPGTFAPTDSWASAQAHSLPEAQTDHEAHEGTPGCWVSGGPLDPQAGGRGDRAPVRGSVSSLPCLETPEKRGVELPKPERRALQRDEEEIARWKRSRWPHIKKRRPAWGPSGLPDESGFLLVPNVTRTWAPRGQTPVVYYLYKQDRISALSVLAVAPKRRRTHVGVAS